LGVSPPFFCIFDLMERLISKSDDDRQNIPVAESSEISIWLDTFDDLFSDFDPRPYSERDLSDDFMAQARKMMKDHSGKDLVLRLLLPIGKRDEALEKTIARRLHNHFRNNHRQIQEETKKVTRKGIVLTFSGVFMLIIASYLSFIKPDKYLFHLLLILFEPAGWFLLWTGLDHLVYFAKTTRKDLGFYSKMAKSKILYANY
jgi:hypothetical protein